jgi:hypothetical protein
VHWADSTGLELRTIRAGSCSDVKDDGEEEEREWTESIVKNAI